MATEITNGMVDRKGQIFGFLHLCWTLFP